MHDLQRVLELAKHFSVPAYCCVNKWDLNQEMTEQIEAMAGQYNAVPLGRISYDAVATKAQMQAQSIIEAGESKAGEEIKAIWQRLEESIFLTSDKASAVEAF